MASIVLPVGIEQDRESRARVQLERVHDDGAAVGDQPLEKGVEIVDRTVM